MTNIDVTFWLYYLNSFIIIVIDYYYHFNYYKFVFGDNLLY